MADLNGTLGWQVGLFAIESLQPEDGSMEGSSTIWAAYCAWCEKRHAVPMSFPVFYAELEEVIEAAGIPRRQVGAHVLYEGVRLRSF